MTLARGISKLLGHPVLIMALAGAALLLVAQGSFMGVDEAIWTYMGRAWVHGEPVYKATMDNKPPGILMVYAAAYSLAGPGIWLPRLLGVLSMTAATGGIYLLGRRLLNPQAGALAAWLFGLAMGWVVMDGANAAQTECFMVLPTVFAFLALLRASAAGTAAARLGYMVLGGLLIGAAISFKQTALFSMLAWAVCYLILIARRSPSADDSVPTRSRHGGRVILDLFVFGLACLAAVAGFVLPVLACAVEFNDYWFGTWVLPLLPGTGNSSLVSRLDKFSQTWLQSSMVLFYLPLVALAWRSNVVRAAGVPLVALLAWLGLEFAAAGSSGYYYGHQIKQLLPPLALLAGLGLAAVIDSRNRSEQGASRLTGLILVLVVLACLPYKTMIQATEPKDSDFNRQLGGYLRDRSGPEEGVLALDWQGFQILAWSDRPCPSRWFNSFFLQLPQARAELSRDLAAKPPRFIALPAWCRDKPWPKFMEQLKPRYKLIYTDRRTNQGEQYEVFERQGS